MTLDEGKRKVYELLDEYGLGDSMDEDLVTKMPDFFDMAQKQIASIQRIVREVEIYPTAGQTLYEMPPDFERLYRVWRGDTIVRRAWRGRKIVINDGNAVTVEYFAAPKTIGPTTPGGYEFEVSETAAQAMPFFVAAEVLAADLVQSPANFLTLWQTMLANLDATLPGSGNFRQSFYR